jgi:hypothetical protein
MTWIDSRSFGEKIIKILSDNRAMPSEWKYHIPIYIVQQPIPIVMNAKYLADGINEAIELYHPETDFYIPSHQKYVQETLF